MAQATISLQTIDQAARHHDGMLRELRAYQLGKTCQHLGFNLIDGIDGQHTVLAPKRKNGLTKPYSGEIQKETQPLLEVIPSTLTLHTGYLQLVDNIQNYAGPKVRLQAGKSPAPLPPGKHPYEQIILRNAMQTLADDIAAALYHGNHDPADLSPLGVYTGILSLIHHLRQNNEIATHQPYQLAAGDPPTLKGDLALFDGISPDMLQGDIDLHLTPALRKWLRELVLGKNPETFGTPDEEIATRLKAELGIRGTLRIFYPPQLTTPLPDPANHQHYLIACPPGTFTLGLGAMRDLQAIQVRNPYPDPNIVQFWMQVDIGARIDRWDPANLYTRQILIKD